MSSKLIAIIGFGSQGKAWALNLRDSNPDFTPLIVLRKKGKSEDDAKKLGFKTAYADQLNELHISTFLMLIPDHEHEIFLETFSSKIQSHSHFIYAHGFSIAFKNIQQKFPQFKHSLLAPKAIASEVRFKYECQGKIGAAYFPHDELAKEEIIDLAKNLGFTSLYLSSFKEEATADLFSEQAILCSILPYASLKAFNLLVKKGIAPEIAFMECFLELKSISTALVNLGPKEFFNLISPNAFMGAEKGLNTLLGAAFEDGLEKLYADIENKNFIRDTENNFSEIRNKVMDRWDKELLTKTFERLKDDLIP
jgi:ketol-acid reductoisomerase